MSEQQGEADPADHVRLYRRIHPRQLVDGPNGTIIVSSAAFSNTTDTDEMSAVAEDVWASCGGRTPHDLLSDGVTARVVAFTTGAARRLSTPQIVVRSPEDPSDPCDAHASVVGDKPKRAQRDLRGLSEQVAP